MTKEKIKQIYQDKGIEYTEYWSSNNEFNGSYVCCVVLKINNQRIAEYGLHSQYTPFSKEQKDSLLNNYHSNLDEMSINLGYKSFDNFVDYLKNKYFGTNIDN